MSEYHAILSPSGSHKWLACPGSVAMEAKYKNESSEYADEGTAAHTLAATCLQEHLHTSLFIGKMIAAGKREFKVTQEFADAVQIYIDAIYQRVEEYKLAGAVSVMVEVEQRVPIGHFTGEEGAEGTSDCIIIVEWPDGTGLLDTWDLKFGMGVTVLAEKNPQGMIYACGALEKFGLLGDFKDVRICISQPRISAIPSEWELTVGELQEFQEFARVRALQALNTLNTAHIENHLVAGDHCKKGFCRARGDCSKYRSAAFSAMGVDFDEIPFANVEGVVAEDVGVAVRSAAEAIQLEEDATLDLLFPNLDLIDDYVRQVRARIEARLFEGAVFQTVKLVEGKQGNRAWSDEAEAEKALKSMRLKQEQMYSFKLISPTVAEKLLKATPRRWNKLTELITRAEGKPSVAPMSDKRPALVVKPSADDFEEVQPGEDLV